MFCEKCGTKNPDDAKFCEKCGAPLNNAPAASSQPAGAPKASKPLPIKGIVAAIAVVAVLVVGFIFVQKMGRTIDLNKYMTVDASGYDGYGTAVVTVDWDAIEEKYGEKLSLNKKATDELGIFSSLVTPMDALEDVVNVSLDKRNQLSNGDVVKYTWKISEDYKKYLNCTLKFKDGEHKVEGLTEVVKFDPFAEVTVTFDGVSPNGNAKCEYSGSDFSPYDFYFDNNGNLKNGDKVTLNVSVSDLSYYAERNGKIPASTSMEYTVSGLPEYALSYSSLSDDFKKYVQKEAEDAISSYVAKNYSKSSSLTNLTYAGYVFNSVKDGSYANPANYLHVIFTGTVSNSDGNFHETTVYFPVRFYNILINGSEITANDNHDIEGYSSLDGWGSTIGYTNPLTCYAELTESYKDNYNNEAGDGIEVYSTHEDITKIDDISVDFRNALYVEAKDTIESYIAKNYTEGTTLTEFGGFGEYLLVAKSIGTDFAKNNKYFIVYKGTLSNSKNRFKAVTVYFPVEFDGVTKLPTGEYIVSTHKGTVGYSSIPDSWYSTIGYTDGAEMYNAIVTSNRDNYTYDMTEELKAFGE